MSEGDRRYSPAEVEEVLRRAAERTRARGDELSHDELRTVALEVGIDPRAVDEEAARVLARREDSSALARYEAARRGALRAHATVFAVVIAALAGLNLLFTPGVLWFAAVALVWGVGLALHALLGGRALTDEQRERVLERVRVARERRERREARREARRGAALPAPTASAASGATAEDPHRATREAAAQLGVAVEHSVTALMSAAAKKLDEVTARANAQESSATSDAGAGPGSFASFVAAQRGRDEGATGAPADARTGVRVVPDEPRGAGAAASEGAPRDEHARAQARAKGR